MSLIKCIECGKEISSSAKVCPNCGYPIEKNNINFEVLKSPYDNMKTEYILNFVGVLTLKKKYINISANNYIDNLQDKFLNDIDFQVTQYNKWCERAPFSQQKEMYNDFLKTIIDIIIKFRYSQLGRNAIRYTLEKMNFSTSEQEVKLYLLNEIKKNTVHTEQGIFSVVVSMSYPLYLLKVHGFEREDYLQPFYNHVLFDKMANDEEYYAWLSKREENTKKERDDKEDEKIVKCPKCGSKSINTVNRGYSMMTGFIGSGSPRNVCQQCGYKWKPGS